MNKTQFAILNICGGICTALILLNLVVSRLNSRLSATLVETQNRLNTAQQVQAMLQQMAVRIAQNADKDPAMVELLKRQQLRVTLTVDGKQKQVP